MLSWISNTFPTLFRFFYFFSLSQGTLIFSRFLYQGNFKKTYLYVVFPFYGVLFFLWDVENRLAFSLLASPRSRDDLILQKMSLINLSLFCVCACVYESGNGDQFILRSNGHIARLFSFFFFLICIVVLPALPIPRRARLPSAGARWRWRPPPEIVSLAHANCWTEPGPRRASAPWVTAS